MNDGCTDKGCRVCNPPAPRQRDWGYGWLVDATLVHILAIGFGLSGGGYAAATYWLLGLIFIRLEQRQSNR